MKASLRKILLTAIKGSIREGHSVS